MKTTTVLPIFALLAACAGGEPVTDEVTDDVTEPTCADDGGCIVVEDHPAGFLCVRAPADDDVWIVGSSVEPDDGTGPSLLHYDGTDWTQFDTSTWPGTELWWTWIDTSEAVFVGNEGLILEMDRSDGSLTKIDGPTSDITFFGVWGASADDLWAVGMTDFGQGPRALWRRQAGVWAAWEDPTLGIGEDGITYFKVHGTSASDVWFVGARGTSAHWDGTDLTEIATDSEASTSGSPILTVDVSGDAPIAVGGAGNALLLEYDGTDWRDLSPDFQPGLNGVCGNGDTSWAVGQRGSRSVRGDDGLWTSDQDRSVDSTTLEDWHGCDVTPDGALWTVGGHIATRPLTTGVIVYQGSNPPPALEL